MFQPITTGGVNYRDQPWHKECFVCIGCKQQLAGQRFTSRDDFAYCLNCFCNLFAKKCAHCTTPISGKMSASIKHAWRRVQVGRGEKKARKLNHNNSLVLAFIQQLVLLPSAKSKVTSDSM